MPPVSEDQKGASRNSQLAFCFVATSQLDKLATTSTEKSSSDETSKNLEHFTCGINQNQSESLNVRGLGNPHFAAQNLC